MVNGVNGPIIVPDAGPAQPGHMGLKMLQLYANLKSAILASKLDWVGMPSLD